MIFFLVENALSDCPISSFHCLRSLFTGWDHHFTGWNNYLFLSLSILTGWDHLFIDRFHLFFDWYHILTGLNHFLTGRDHFSLIDWDHFFNGPDHFSTGWDHFFASWYHWPWSLFQWSRSLFNWLESLVWWSIKSPKTELMNLIKYLKLYLLHDIDNAVLVAKSAKDIHFFLCNQSTYVMSTYLRPR